MPIVLVPRPTGALFAFLWKWLYLIRAREIFSSVSETLWVFIRREDPKIGSLRA